MYGTDLFNHSPADRMPPYGRDLISEWRSARCALTRRLFHPPHLPSSPCLYRKLLSHHSFSRPAMVCAAGHNERAQLRMLRMCSRPRAHSECLFYAFDYVPGSYAARARMWTEAVSSGQDNLLLAHARLSAIARIVHPDGKKLGHVNSRSSCTTVRSSQRRAHITRSCSATLYGLQPDAHVTLRVPLAERDEGA